MSGTAFKNLFSPIKIHSMEVKNRIFMPPMGTMYAKINGEVTDRLIAYYVERGKGGVGCIVVEFTNVRRDGNTNDLANTALYDDGLIPGYRKLVDAVHGTGTKIAIQLAHAGRRAHSKVIGEIPVAPSPIPRLNGEVPRELTIDEIQAIIEDFARAAARAQKAGFDAVNLHMAHGYLINQFLSPRSNHRKDQYGGDLEGRSRFAIEVLRRTRDKVGEDFPITCRLCGDEVIPGGFDLKQSRVVAQKLEENGADAIDISGGANEGLYGSGAAPSYRPLGFMTPFSQAIKEVVTIPVGIAGRIHDPFLAEKILEERKADFICLGRPLIADPELPRKLLEGRLEDIRPCTSCNLGCIDRIYRQLDMSCQTNPMVGREMECGIDRASKKKKILIIGGGPAGLEAARVAALRRHKVILYEKEKRLGGQLNLASKPPHKVEYEKLVQYYENQMNKLKVQVIHKEAQKEEIRKIKPDAIILATGGKPHQGQGIKIHSNRVCSAWEVLKGEKSVGESVVIIGGGQVGCETADFLLERGKKVTLLEMQANVGMGMHERSRIILVDKLIRGGVNIVKQAVVKEISDSEIKFEREGLKERLKEFDNVVLALGTVPENTLAKKLSTIKVPIFSIGDCVSPRKAVEAIREGFDLGREI
jgi:2,4-dienoyl-CoA reductase-like NADH-dependent reductase (Old Yellow Enzyme family)/thioredoxin reductase